MKIWLLKAIQERKTDVASKLLRSGLFVLSLVYRGVVQCRNWAYDNKWLRIQSVDANVISIGNLTTGGTGKTPIVIWLANQLQPSTPTAIVSRGYGAMLGNLNDEGMEIAWKAGDVVQVQAPDRVQAANTAIQTMISRSASAASDDRSNGRPILLLDDGFQHRRLSRDLNILLIDATNPFGYGHVLPRGLLREPITEVRRADFVILTRADQVAPEIRNSIRRKIQGISNRIDWAEVIVKPQGWLSPQRQRFASDHLRGKQVFAFCGIGNPNSFHQTLLANHITINGFKSFDDHYHYREHDVAQLVDEARRANCQTIVCTVKDLVKIPAELRLPADITILALSTEIEFQVGENLLLDRIGQYLPKLKNAG